MKKNNMKNRVEFPLFRNNSRNGRSSNRNEVIADGIEVVLFINSITWV